MRTPPIRRAGTWLLTVFALAFTGCLDDPVSPGESGQTLLFAPSISASSSTAFESFSLGSVHYQGPGSTTSLVGPTQTYTIPDPYGSLWTVADEWGLSVNAFDQEVQVDGTGNTVWRFSNAVTSRGFSDQPNTPSTDPAGESGAALYNDRGDDHTMPLSPPNPRASASTPYFHAGFRFKSATGAPQSGLRIDLSPIPRQSSFRMSFVRIEDVGTGLDLIFFETDASAAFVGGPVATGLSYTDWHQLDIYIEFVDGSSANDIVTIVLNGTPIHTGTTWESFFDQTAGFPSPIAVDAIMFRASGTEAPGTLGAGLFFDDVVVDNEKLVLDDQPPAVTDVLATPNPVEVNGTYDLTANVDDTGLGDSNIASAEFAFNGGAATPMAAADGAFDMVSEDVEALGLASPADAGLFDLCVRGTDEAGNTSAFECIKLVVYDPDGGFVTGGGWIDSPAGAYTPETSLTGKANFGFVSKYKKGASVPTGNTEFQFKAGDLNFHSSSYDWLVVTGSDFARFKGEGTINGSGSFKFMLWAGDETGPNGEDTFRIKIWEEGGGVEDVVYDNGMNQPIGGGSIIVHTKGK